MPTILHLLKVSPSEYHPRYSPLRTLSSTVTSLLCQNASFVFRTESLILRPVVYWNEYFASILSPSISRSELSRNGYSEVSEQSRMRMPRHFHPNSTESIPHISRETPEHSLRALGPPRSHLDTVPSVSYHSAARQVPDIELSSSENLLACQSG